MELHSSMPYQITSDQGKKILESSEFKGQQKTQKLILSHNLSPEQQVKDNQSWILEEVRGYYKIKQKMSGFVLTATATTNAVKLAAWEGEDTQLWEVIKDDSDLYRVKNKKNGKALTYDDTSALQVLKEGGKSQYLWGFEVVSPVLSRPSKFQHEMTFDEAMKAVVVKATSFIPEAGDAISGVIAFFWPDADINNELVEFILKETNKLIDGKILEQVMRERGDELTALKKTMLQFEKAKKREKGALLAVMLGQTNGLYEKVTTHSYSVHLLPFVVYLANLHLCILHERLKNGKEMYEEDNSAEWKNDLEKKYKEYISKLNTLVGRWETWRKEQIEVTDTSSIHPLGTSSATYEDKFNGYKATFDFHKSIYTSAKKIAETVKEKNFNEAKAELIRTLSSTSYLHRYLPEKKDAPAQPLECFESYEIGPFHTYAFGKTRNGGRNPDDVEKLSDPTVKSDFKEVGGKIKSIVVRKGNIIDALEITYNTHMGYPFGNMLGGSEEKFSFTENQSIVGVKAAFVNEMAHLHGKLARIEFLYTEEGKDAVNSYVVAAGKYNSNNVNEGFAEAANDYQLYCVSAQNRKEIYQLQFTFRHKNIPETPFSFSQINRNYIVTGSFLIPGEYIVSPNGEYMLEFEQSGDLVIYNIANNKKIREWHTNTKLDDPAAAEYEYGVLKVYKKDAGKYKAEWSQGTKLPNYQNTAMYLSDEGELIVKQGEKTLHKIRRLHGCKLVEGDFLLPGEYLLSDNGKYKMYFQYDGSLEVHDVSDPQNIKIKKGVKITTEVAGRLELNKGGILRATKIVNNRSSKLWESRRVSSTPDNYCLLTDEGRVELVNDKDVVFYNVVE